MIKRIKRAVIGKPLPSWEFKHQRLNNLTALAVFASDSLSSVAYATEEIFLVLMSVGPALLGFSLPISLVILFKQIAHVSSLDIIYFFIYFYIIYIK